MKKKQLTFNITRLTINNVKCLKVLGVIILYNF